MKNVNIDQPVINLQNQEYEGDIYLRNNQTLNGNGATLKGSIIITDIDQGENITIRDLIIQPKDSSGIVALGLRKSHFSNIRIETSEQSTNAAVNIIAVRGYGVYFNKFENIHVGQNKNGFSTGFHLASHNETPRRFNSNTFINCTARFCQMGFTLLNGVGNTLIGCESEANNKGFYIVQCKDTTLTGGYAEDNTKGDVLLNQSTSTKILGTALNSKLKIVGPGVGATGDFYLVAGQNFPSQEEFGNWADKFHINQLSNSWIEHKSYDKESPAVYLGFKGESGHKCIIYNTGKMVWPKAKIEPLKDGGINISGKVFINGKEM